MCLSCPRCGSVRVKCHGNYAKGLKRHFCKACGKTFNDKTGTLFHYSRLSLREWFIHILLCIIERIREEEERLEIKKEELERKEAEQKKREEEYQREDSELSEIRGKKRGEIEELRKIKEEKKREKGEVNRLVRVHLRLTEEVERMKGDLKELKEYKRRKAELALICYDMERRLKEMKSKEEFLRNEKMQLEEECKKIANGEMEYIMSLFKQLDARQKGMILSYLPNDEQGKVVEEMIKVGLTNQILTRIKR